jgi:ribosome-binding protein aMBF1 (putative translation factor)
MRAVVTCECCGNRQAVARQITHAESFFVVCHSCESVLRVEVNEDDLRAARISEQAATAARRLGPRGQPQASTTWRKPAR